MGINQALKANEIETEIRSCDTDGRAGHRGDTSGRFRTVRGIYRIHKRIPRDSVGIWTEDMSIEYLV